MKRHLLLELWEGDEHFLLDCISAGILQDAEDLLDDQVEAALVARTLIRELEVNWPGVEIILRMRAELLESRRQLARVADLLRARSSG
jgi:hypothetical protein